MMKKIAILFAFLITSASAQTFVFHPPEVNSVGLTWDQCVVGTIIDFASDAAEGKQRTPVDLGFHLVVKGVSKERDGIYRVFQIAKFPNAQGLIVRFELRARCIKTPGTI